MYIHHHRGIIPPPSHGGGWEHGTRDHIYNSLHAFINQLHIVYTDDMEVSKSWGTPSYHPFLDRMSH